MSEPRIVKRYANRKLYDTQHSRYVTLDQIAAMIRAGEDVRIIDNNSKEDLTALTLTQIIFEEEKRQSFLPLSALRGIIQTGSQSLQQIASQAGEKARLVFRRDKEGGEEAQPEPPPPLDPTASDSSSPGAIRELLERSQHTFDEWQKRVDERIQKVVEALNPLGGVEKELRALQQRIAELESKLKE